MFEDVLLAVTLLYRHGDRTPIRFYPNDPHLHSPIWTEAPGDLTNAGKLQMYELGQWLRKRYDGFLSRNYKRNEIFVQASNKDRCIRSAAANLAGLYPPVDKDIWNSKLLWQPIPIHSVPEKYDTTLYFLEACPKYTKLFSEITKSIDEENMELYEYLTEHTGSKIDKIMDAALLWDALDIEEKNSLTLPEWTKSVYPEKLKNLRDEAFRKHSSYPEITKLVSGRFLHELLGQFTSMSENNGGKVPKIKIYSGHDLNIDVLLSSLKIPHSVDIPLAAALMFELWKRKDGSLYVTIVYKTENVETLEIEGIGPLCEFETFSEILRGLALSEEEYHKLYFS